MFPGPSSPDFLSLLCSFSAVPARPSPPVCLPAILEDAALCFCSGFSFLAVSVLNPHAIVHEAHSSAPLPSSTPFQQLFFPLFFRLYRKHLFFESSLTLTGERMGASLRAGHLQFPPVAVLCTFCLVPISYFCSDASPSAPFFSFQSTFLTSPFFAFLTSFFLYRVSPPDCRKMTFVSTGRAPRWSRLTSIDPFLNPQPFSISCTSRRWFSPTEFLKSRRVCPPRSPLSVRLFKQSGFGTLFPLQRSSTAPFGKVGFPVMVFLSVSSPLFSPILSAQLPFVGFRPCSEARARPLRARRCAFHKTIPSTCVLFVSLGSEYSGYDRFEDGRRGADPSHD